MKRSEINAVHRFALPLLTWWFPADGTARRAGADFALNLRNTAPDGVPSDSPVKVHRDGLRESLPSGSLGRLRPHESLTLRPGLLHAFRAAGDTSLAGEVSSVNGDDTHNVFLKTLPHFHSLEEDDPQCHEPQCHLLVGDYHA